MTDSFKGEIAFYNSMTGQNLYDTYDKPSPFEIKLIKSEFSTEERVSIVASAEKVRDRYIAPFVYAQEVIKLKENIEDNELFVSELVNLLKTIRGQHGYAFMPD